MNKYQSIYQSGNKDITENELIKALDNISSWEDAYWLAKIVMNGNYEIQDERIIETLEYCFFMGLSISFKEIFFDANECLAKLYIRYGLYDEAASKLILLTDNFDCPDWVHLYLAMTQLYTIFSRIVEEPKFFFERLSLVNMQNKETKQEVKNIFSKYLCLIVENDNYSQIAIDEIINFAEQIKITASDEFKLFHSTKCPDKKYEIVSESNEEYEELLESHALIEKKAVQLEEELNKSKASERKYHDELIVKNKALSDLESENGELSIRLEETSREYQERLKEKDTVVADLENENSLLAKRIKELESVKQTTLHADSIDDIFLKITGWLNVSLKRYLAQWLNGYFTRNCRNDFWSKKVKPSLTAKEIERFDLYKELSDFAIDALLNIYYNNLDDFYTFNSMAKKDDRERIKEMQKIRNRWVGHFEENAWTKEKILFDIQTIIEFTEQIEMPYDKRKEYIEYKALVEKMN